MAPGFDLANCRYSLIFLAATVGCVRMMFCSDTIKPMGAKSLCVSNGTFCIAGLTISRPMWPRPTVWPSGSACFNSSSEMMPLAPARLSMTTCLPSAAVNLGCSMRPTRSVAPPGGLPTMKRIDFVGDHSAACTDAASSMAAANSIIRHGAFFPSSPALLPEGDGRKAPRPPGEGLG